MVLEIDNEIGLKTSVADVLRYYGIRNVREAGHEISFSCPFHPHDRNPSASISVKKGLWICYSCSARGNMWQFIASQEGCSVEEARAMWTQGFHVVIPKMEELWDPEDATLDEAALHDPKISRYLLKRGFDRETQGMFRTSRAKLRRAIYVELPCFDSKGNLKGIIYRAVRKSIKPKYLYTKGFRRKAVLFGLYELKVIFPQTRHVVLVEGPLDAMRLFQFKVPAVSALGSMLSLDQAELLSRFDQVSVCGDDDASGKVFTNQAIKTLSPMIPGGVDALELPEGYSDPGDLKTEEAVEQLLASAENALLSEIREILSEGGIM